MHKHKIDEEWNKEIYKMREELQIELIEFEIDETGLQEGEVVIVMNDEFIKLGEYCGLLFCQFDEKSFKVKINDLFKQEVITFDDVIKLVIPLKNIIKDETYQKAVGLLGLIKHDTQFDKKSFVYGFFSGCKKYLNDIKKTFETLSTEQQIQEVKKQKDIIDILVGQLHENT